MSQITGNCKIESHGELTRFFLPGFPICHGFFARTGGFSKAPFSSFNTAYATPDPHAPKNRNLLFQTLGLGSKPLRILNPCHGSQIIFEEETSWKTKNKAVLIKTDAAFTRTPDTYFLLSTGDCIPAIFTDESCSFMGLIHLGWRNLWDNFTEKVISALQNHYQISPASFQIGIGPLIYPCCYLSEDPIQKNALFWQPFLQKLKNGLYRVDLSAAFKAQLIHCGVSSENIWETGLCTGCHTDIFFSCYKEGYLSGRFPVIAGLAHG